MSPESKNPDRPQKPVIEQGEVFKSDPDRLFEGYFDEIRSGIFRPRTDADVEKVVSLELSAKPITELTESELERLREYLKKNVQVRFIPWINSRYRNFIEHPIYLV